MVKDRIILLVAQAKEFGCFAGIILLWTLGFTRISIICLGLFVFFLASTLHSITSRCGQLNVAFPLVVFVLLILYFSFLLHYHCGLNRIFLLSMQTILCYSSVLRSFTGLYFFTDLFTANFFVLTRRSDPGGVGCQDYFDACCGGTRTVFTHCESQQQLTHFTCNVKESKLGISLWLLTIFLRSSVSVGLKIEPRLCFIQQNCVIFCEGLAIF